MLANYFMCRLSRYKPDGQMCSPGSFYARFYSRDEFPWYQAGIVVQNKTEARRHFDDFVEKCEAHRSQE